MLRISMVLNLQTLCCQFKPHCYFRYCISTSPFSQQLPTIVLFRGGKEIGRRPVVDNKGKVVKVFFSKVRPANICDF